MISMIFQILMPIMKFLVQRHTISEETKQKFFEFVKMSENSSSVTLGIRNDYKHQLEELIVSKGQKSDEKNSLQ